MAGISDPSKLWIKPYYLIIKREITELNTNKLADSNLDQWLLVMHEQAGVYHHDRQLAKVIDFFLICGDLFSIMING